MNPNLTDQTIGSFPRHNFVIPQIVIIIIRTRLVFSLHQKISYNTGPTDITAVPHQNFTFSTNNNNNDSNTLRDFTTTQ